MGLWDGIRRMLSGQRENEKPVISKQEARELVWAKQILDTWPLDKICQVHQLWKEEIFYSFTRRSPEDYSYNDSYLLDFNMRDMQEKYWDEYQRDWGQVVRSFEDLILSAEKVFEDSNSPEVRAKLTKAERALDELKDYIYLMQRVTDRYISQDSKYISPKDPNPITESDLEKLTGYCKSLESSNVKAYALLRIAKIRETLLMPESKEFYELIIKEFEKIGREDMAERLKAQSNRKGVQEHLDEVKSKKPERSEDVNVVEASRIGEKRKPSLVRDGR